MQLAANSGLRPVYRLKVGTQAGLPAPRRGASFPRCRGVNL